MAGQGESISQLRPAGKKKVIDECLAPWRMLVAREDLGYYVNWMHGDRSHQRWLHGTSPPASNHPWLLGMASLVLAYCI